MPHFHTLYLVVPFGFIVIGLFIALVIDIVNQVKDY
jgi:hypothetical protein